MEDDEIQSQDRKPSPTAEIRPDLSALVIALLKGVIYRDTDERLWGTLLKLRAPVRDYVAVLALDLMLDEAEGYAFLKSRSESENGQDLTIEEYRAQKLLHGLVATVTELERDAE